MTKSTKPALALLTTVKAIDAGIERIHVAGQTLQTDMHLVACSVLQHVGKHKDTRVLLKLMNAMPEMARKNSLILWFETFGNVKYAMDTKAFVLVTDKGIKLGEAIDKPFWKFKANEGVEYEAIDIVKYVNAQVAKLTKDSEKSGTDHSVLIRALKQAVAPAVVQ